MSGHSMEEMRQHVKTYLLVFATLLFLTVVTVGIAYIHLPIAQAVTLALIVATCKASLVALFFMHLSNEKKVIYAALGLTGVFFVFEMCISMFL